MVIQQAGKTYLFPTVLFLLSAALVLTFCSLVIGRDEGKDSSDDNKMEQVFSEWEKETKAEMEKQPPLRALLSKYPLVILHSRVRYPKHSRHTYCFIEHTSDPEVHKNRAQLEYNNGGDPNQFEVNLTVSQQNLIADLGDWDFSKDPKPKDVDIDGKGQMTWFPGGMSASQNHTYLERVRDSDGSKFYVIFKVLRVDNSHVAFIHRQLPGGRVRRAQMDNPPENEDKGAKLDHLLAQWERETRSEVEKHPTNRALLSKYALVILHSRIKYPEYWRHTYSFIEKSSDSNVHLSGGQLQYDNGGNPNQFVVNIAANQRNLIADLGDCDFSKDPVPKNVDIDGEGQRTWFPGHITALQDHTYLERVRDSAGNTFYVLIKVLHLDDSHVAFIYRQLPAGQLKSGEPVNP